MKPAIDILEERISAAMETVTHQSGCKAIVRPTQDPKFGDYQANGIMGAAKRLKTNPRKLADEVVHAVDLGDLCSEVDVAGPGFINLRLSGEYLADKLLEMQKDQSGRLGVDKVARPLKTVVDFSSPNIAKEMHVGHLRSTIIGDCICRLLEFSGHEVIRQNHIGDWGRQFGRVLLGLWHMCMAQRKHGGEPYYHRELQELSEAAGDEQQIESLCKRMRDRHEADWRDDSLNELGDGEKYYRPFLDDLGSLPVDEMWREFLTAYQYVSLLEDSAAGLGLIIPTRSAGDVPYELLSRHVTTMLQNWEAPENKQERDAWEKIRELTLKHCGEIYEKLNVSFDDDEIRGESFYRDMLGEVVEELEAKGLAKESEGAVCVFPEGFKNKEGEPLPLIVRKSDGAYLYATTDLAAVRYRVKELGAKRIVYVTDARQSLHFEMFFAVARAAGWVKEDVDLAHVTFGSVLGEDGKPLKTRSGENVRLGDLLDEAVQRARAVVDQKNPELDDAQKDEIARAVGIGAVKYADYSNNRTSDYIFSFDKMLAMDGNTAPYMQYAYARIKSIERKAESKDVDVETELAGIDQVKLGEAAEVDLAKHLCRYGEAVESAAGDYRPNYLTSYLYELAQKFSAFYTNCPVLKAGADQRPSRLLLCDLTARTIRHGLTELLGIDVIEQM